MPREQQIKGKPHPLLNDGVLYIRTENSDEEGVWRPAGRDAVRPERLTGKARKARLRELVSAFRS